MNHTGFWWVILAGGLYGLLHSLLASNPAKAWSDRRLGEAFTHRFYRLFFVSVAGVSLLPVLALAALLPNAVIYTIPPPWSWLALLVQGLAMVGLLIAVNQTDMLSFLGLRQMMHFDPQHSLPRPEKLVTGGLYRWVRHPLYSFSFVLLWLLPVMTWNGLGLNLSLSAYLVIGAMLEERKLFQQFGTDYQLYRQRTPMLIPFLKRT